jgi:hypothetical protein
MAKTKRIRLTAIAAMTEPGMASAVLLADNGLPAALVLQQSRPASNK